MTSVDLEIGVRIRELRRARGLSQRELAKLIGVSPHSLSSAERGAPLTASRLLAVARVLGARSGSCSASLDDDRRWRCTATSRRSRPMSLGWITAPAWR